VADAIFKQTFSHSGCSLIRKCVQVEVLSTYRLPQCVICSSVRSAAILKRPGCDNVLQRGLLVWCPWSLCFTGCELLIVCLLSSQKSFFKLYYIYRLYLNKWVRGKWKIPTVSFLTSVKRVDFMI